MPNQPISGASWLAKAAGHTGDDCLNWPFGWRSVGYGMLEVGGRRIRAHRYMCELAHGAAPSLDSQAAHSCGNRLCVNPKHLRWATPKENSADAKMHGVAPVGSKHGRARLTEQQVFEIREMVERGLASRKDIAREYRVHPSTISLAVSGKNWAHVA